MPSAELWQDVQAQLGVDECRRRGAMYLRRPPAVGVFRKRGPAGPRVDVLARVDGHPLRRYPSLGVDLAGKVPGVLVAV